MATIAKLPNGKFKAIIKSDGRILKTKTFQKKSNARIWAKRIEQDQEQLFALGLSGSKLTFKQLANEYMDGNKLLFTFVDKIGPAKPIIEITTENIRELMNWYGSGKVKRTGKKRTAGTYNRAKACISGCFGYAVGNGYLLSNPVKGIPSKSEGKGRTRYLSDAERIRLLEAVKKSPWSKLHLLIVLAITTGARRNELMNLRWSNIDFENKVFYLYDTKNGSDRVCPLPLPTITELKKYREIGDSLVFPSAKVPKHPFCFEKQWRDALERADIANFRFHDLRHSCASYLAQEGFTLLQIADVLGHKSIQTTMRYAHLSVKSKADIVGKVFDDMI